MTNTNRVEAKPLRVVLLTLALAALPAVSCDSTDSVGSLGADAAPDAHQCIYTVNICQNGSRQDSYGCWVCNDPLPIATGGAGTAGTTGQGGAGGNSTADAAADGSQCVTTNVSCPNGYVNDPVTGCPVCAAAGTGGSASGGKSGSGGASGGVGGASGGVGGNGGDGGNGGATGKGGATGTGGTTAIDGGATCGSAICGAGQYCCNASCSLCAPAGVSCIQTECVPDASASVDGNGCKAVPSNDATRCGGTRPAHYYTCQLTMLESPCVMLSIGDIVNTFCCP